MSNRCLKFCAAVCVVSIGLSGCGHAANKAASVAGAATTAANQAVGDAHGHDGWWCSEHGVPEEVCAQCSAKVAAEFKAKGDWCKEHDRPESQCFICHPEKQADFAAVYEAKFGTTPPAPVVR